MKQIRSNELLEEFYKEYNINEFDLLREWKLKDYK